jgi:hypothetical protein
VGDVFVSGAGGECDGEGGGLLYTMSKLCPIDYGVFDVRAR